MPDRLPSAPTNRILPGINKQIAWSIDDLRRWLLLLRWLLPMSLVVLVIAYELLPARWVYEQYGFGYHVLLDILIFGTIGPALAFVLLNFLERWLEERDTSDLQMQIVAQARADAQKSRQLTDHAVQVLFSAGALLTTLKANQKEVEYETAVQIEATEQALTQAVEDLRAHLLDG